MSHLLMLPATVQNRLVLLLNELHTVPHRLTKHKVNLSSICVAVASHGSLISAKYTDAANRSLHSHSSKHKPLHGIWRVCSLFSPIPGTLDDSSAFI